MRKEKISVRMLFGVCGVLGILGGIGVLLIVSNFSRKDPFRDYAMPVLVSIWLITGGIFSMRAAVRTRKPREPLSSTPDWGIRFQELWQLHRMKEAWEVLTP